MFPVCSATPSCSSHSQISLHAGLRSFPPSRKAIEVRCIMEDRVFMGTSITQEISFKSQATKSLYTHVIERPESGSMEFINIPPYPNELDDIERQFPNKWNYSTGSINEPDPIGRGILNYVESSNISTQEEELMDLPDQFTENTNILSGNAAPETISTFDATSNVVSENLTSVSDSLDKANDSLPSLKTNIEDFLSGVNESISGSVDKGEHAVKSSLDEITSSLTYAINSATEAVDNAVKTVFSTVDQTGELAGNGLTSFSSDLKEATSKAGFIAIDVLRRAIVAVEDYVASGTTFVLYSYGSAKELLPTEVRNVLNLSEEKAIEILRPVGTAFKQVYVTVEGLEKNLGLDPTDPIIPFVLFLGTSTTLGISYWVLTYGGYSGDLSPQSTLELLTGEEKVVLIDVRPEDLRERDGIPDLRRGARFKYASVTLPEIDGSVKGLVKSGRDLNDALIAAVIRNLKIIPDRSQIIVMDADGTRSKGIARSLRKFGVKRPYLVQGGFRSWVTNGLRVKELKPETTLTILNEEAEAILEDIRLTPVQVVGYGLGFIVAIYALLEWEKTLQLLGIVGLGQTIYRRLASYEDTEDFKQDVRLLLAPVRFGAQAFSWAAGKLEPNRIGLPTSPLSSAVQNRVLQAAAKHGSQPSDTAEEMQDSSRESMTPVSENVDLSEA